MHIWTLVMNWFFSLFVFDWLIGWLVDWCVCSESSVDCQDISQQLSQQVIIKRVCSLRSKTHTNTLAVHSTSILPGELSLSPYILCNTIPPCPSQTEGEGTVVKEEECIRNTDVEDGWTSLSKVSSKVTKVVQLLYPGRNTSASTVCCTSAADRSATSSQHLRSSGIRRRWSNDVQLICETPLSAQQLSDNCWKHTFTLPISTFSALGVSHVMRYINLH